jgi:hypothetical protein
MKRAAKYGLLNLNTNQEVFSLGLNSNQADNTIMTIPNTVAVRR